VSELAYPILNQLEPYPSPELLRQAVEKERTRLLTGPAPKPQSEFGKSVKEHTDVPTVVIERLQQRAEVERKKRAKANRAKGSDQPF
jgi:hypothetical protein